MRRHHNFDQFVLRRRFRCDHTIFYREYLRSVLIEFALNTVLTMAEPNISDLFVDFVVPMLR